MAQGAPSQGGKLRKSEATDASQRLAHSLRGDALPKYWAMLEPSNRHLYDPRAHLHAQLWLLGRGNRSPYRTGLGGAETRRGGSTEDGPAPCRRYFGESR